MSNKNQCIAEIKDLVVHYDTENGLVQAVNGLNLSLRRREALGLVGETGAGKTTAALAIMRMVPDPPGKIVSGSILLDEKSIMELTEEQLAGIRGKDVSMIFQDPMTALNPVLTVGEQIAESIQIHERVSAGEAMERAKEILEIVGIHRSRANDYPHQLSGGMKQRVVIAIALACHTKLLIADEPTTALDVTIQAQVLELIKKYREKYETAMLMITHDLGCDVRRQHCGMRHTGGCVQLHPPPLHGGTVFLPAQHQSAGGPPYPDSRGDARPYASAQGVQLRPALRLCHRGLRPDETVRLYGQ